MIEKLYYLCTTPRRYYHYAMIINPLKIKKNINKIKIFKIKIFCYTIFLFVYGGCHMVIGYELKFTEIFAFSLLCRSFI